MKAKPSRGASMERDLARIAERVSSQHEARAWPSPKWAADPVGFMRTYLAFEPWERQQEIAELVRDNPRVAIASGHRIGKPLALDTPIPTPSGWTTMGDIRVGDTVFSDEGQPTRVTFVGDILTGRECFDLEFSDGTIITADGDHEWVTETLGCGPPVKRTTREIAATLFFAHTVAAVPSVRSAAHGALARPRRAIVSVRPRPSVPVRCIRVDATSHQYLCSRAFIPTHNTDLLAALAIWFYCCFRDARAILLGPTSKQIDGAAYRSVRKLLHRGGRCIECAAKDPDGPRPCPHSALIAGDISTSSDFGVRSTNDQREIRGVNVASPEAAQGIAGENILILADEASGPYFDKIMGAMAGNRAGGAKMVLFGNPIRSDGEFSDAFDTKRDFYVTRNISSEEGPNVRAGRVVVPGLATRDWVEEQVAEYGGRDSPFFKMRVLGQFVRVTEGGIFPPDVIEASAALWKALRDPATGAHYVRPDGPLVVSLDPAGESGAGDDTVLMVRRGNDVLELYPRRGLSYEAQMREAVALVERHRHPGELASIAVDSEGDDGAHVRGQFLAYIDAHPDVAAWLTVHYVRSGKPAQRDPERYQQVRDEMCAACLDWMKRGGAIPDDPKLKVELQKFAWLRHVSGRAKATSKEGPGGLREKLGRSPGRADVLMLSTWVRLDASAQPAAAPPPPTTMAQALDQLQRGSGAPGRAPAPWNPYAALNDFYRR